MYCTNIHSTMSNRRVAIFPVSQALGAPSALGKDLSQELLAHESTTTTLQKAHQLLPIPSPYPLVLPEVDKHGTRFGNSSQGMNEPDVGSFAYTVPPKNPERIAYRLLYRLQFGNGNFVTVAEPRILSKSAELPEGLIQSKEHILCEMNAFYEREIELVMIKELQDSIWAKQATYLRENTGESVVKCLDIFQHEGKHYAVYEYITLSLFELQANPLFDDLSLASVMGQILPSLAKLEAKGLEHGQLTTSNILIDLHGTVKLCRYPIAEPRRNHRTKDYHRGL